MKIVMPRGDIRPVQFSIQNPDGTNPEIEFDEIYFTVKQSYTKNDYYFQKRLSDGGIIKNEQGYYFRIEAEDTDRLKIGKYVFDIEVVLGEEIKQTFVGQLELTNEVTFAINEV